MEFTTYVEIKIRAYVEHQPEEKEERCYPGCDESFSLYDVKFETEDGDRILTMDTLKKYIILKEGDTIEEEAAEI